MLPSGYTYVDYLRLYNQTYLNTGILPQSRNKYEMLVGNVTLYGMYLFGARNTNSNTSAGQLNLYINQDSTSYFGFNNARVNLGNGIFNSGGISYDDVAHISINANELDIVRANVNVIEASGNATDFDGTRSIYVGGLNNAGNYLEGACNLYGLNRYDRDGILTHSLIPCTNENNRFGVYNQVNNEFISATYGSYTFTDYKRVTINTNIDEAEAYVMTVYNEKVNEVLTRDTITLYAENNSDYVFVNWSVNGEVISSDRTFKYRPSSDVVVEAIFTRKIKDDFCIGYKSMAIRYGASNTFDDATLRDNFFANIISANLNTSLIEKATSTIVLESMPSTFAINEPLFIFSLKGQVVYCGIIKAIEDRTLTCEEPLSIFDQEFLFTANSLTTNYSLMYSVYDLMSRAKSLIGTTTVGGSAITTRKFTNFSIEVNQDVYLQENQTFAVTTPQITETKVSNLEAYLRDIFNQFGIFVKSSFEVITRTVVIPPTTRTSTRAYMVLKPHFIYEKEHITISDNVETIRNVSITLEDTENTWLVITNDAGSSVRAIYGVENDGTVTRFSDGTTMLTNYSDYIAYNNYQIKIVNSSNNIKQIVAQNISNAQFNHKITFDLYLNGSLLDFETLELGRLVKFYYEDKIYESVITALKYNIQPNNDNINFITVTLGKARNSLTSKINLGKVK